MPRNVPLKLVAIGGGTGLSTLLAGLRPRLNAPEPQLELTAIVTMTDDGKSSGRLREEFSVLPPGDIRNCLVALAPPDNPLTSLFAHRFPGQGALGGHSLGNLLLLGLLQKSGNFVTAIDQARALLGIRARVLPSTLDQVDLVARVGRQKIRGQVAIKSQNSPIQELTLEPANAAALPAAVEAILAADLITLGPGSLFTSVIANLLVPGLTDALSRTKAKKLYICNVMTELDETEDLSGEDHVRELLAYAPDLRLDYALFNSTPISAEMRQRYAAEKAEPLSPPTVTPSDLVPLQFIALPLASEERAVRHDPERLSQAIFDVYAR